jgi:membrane associated rhomboid family serine protease
MSIFSNNIAVLIVGSTIEFMYGPYVTAALYFSCGIVGNIFAAAAMISDYPKAEAATCIVGLIACLVGYIILNYRYLGTFGEDNRYNIVCILILFIFMLTIFFVSNFVEGSDQMGYLGGFMAGVILGALIPPPLENGAYEK